MRILVVDDEPLLVKGIRFNLESEGWQVDACHDGAAAVEMVRTQHYDLVMLDVMMPVMDGLEACMHIRESSNVPIIMLTAKGEDTDKLLGFEYGADDYITKPFNILELKARVRALLRRSGMAAPAASSADSAALSCGDFSLDPDLRIARRDGEEVNLTVKEFDLMELLMRSPEKVFSRETLLNTVWGYDYQGDGRTVDVHVRRLREKLERDPASPAHIMTKWGVGYFFKA